MLNKTFKFQILRFDWKKHEKLTQPMANLTKLLGIPYLVGKIKFTLPETNIAVAPENKQGPKRKVIFQPSIFRGYVSFREGN